MSPEAVSNESLRYGAPGISSGITSGATEKFQDLSVSSPALTKGSLSGHAGPSVQSLREPPSLEPAGKVREPTVSLGSLSHLNQSQARRSGEYVPQTSITGVNYATQMNDDGFISKSPSVTGYSPVLNGFEGTAFRSQRSCPSTLRELGGESIGEIAMVKDTPTQRIE